MAKQPEIKKELGDQATVSNISKRSAVLWKALSPKEREHWDAAAARDKQRFMTEKAQYTGPWQVPWKRAKKDPAAPKRPMSAFLYFSQGRRSQIKAANPDLRNTQVSRILGEMWRNLSDEERRPHVDKEKEEREKYKAAVVEWKQENEARLEAQRKAAADHQIQMQQHQLSMNIPDARALLLADPYEPQDGLVPGPFMNMAPMGFNPRKFAGNKYPSLKLRLISDNSLCRLNFRPRSLEFFYDRETSDSGTGRNSSLPKRSRKLSGSFRKFPASSTLR